ncbi:MAG: hypothetical protein ACLRVT_07810 [Oscillospiraceae bacterium]
MRAAFYTLGCKVNQYETEILMQRFGAAGFDIVPTGILRMSLSSIPAR